MREKKLGSEKETTIVGDHLTILGFTFGVDSILEEVTGFSPLWFPRGKSLFPLSLVLLCLLFSQLNILI